MRRQAVGRNRITPNEGNRVRSLIVLLILVAIAAGGFVWFQSTGSAPDLASLVPPASPVGTGGYVSSETCKQCHADQHSSWHKTYHRTMTQLAEPQNVIPAFDDVQLEADGVSARLFRKRDEFWVEMDDPEWERELFTAGKDTRAEPAPQRVESRVVLTTGSHHFQAYWLRSAYGRELWQFPWRYDLQAQAWVHRRDVFLGPPEWRPGMHFRVWNNNCILCHATGGQPGLDVESNYMSHTAVTEYGIACEACHGPGAEHVKKHENAAANVQITATSTDDSIVNPAKLDHQLSSEICGSCHSNFRHDDMQEILTTGPSFRPGRRLTEFGRFFRPETENDEDVVSRFWADGVTRSTGREFMGLKESACYRRGEMSCLSCHSMHDSDPDDQLAVRMETNEACLQCHEEFRQRLSEHTHHAADSSGSLCYNCHMPYTNYGLFKATRSHQITNPVVASITYKSRPNACNLCHLDQTLDWSATHLSEWYGTDGVELSDDELTVSAWILWLLRGDAGQRVIAAWHARWPAALATSGHDWLVPIVARVTDDPYAAVRQVAETSLGALKQLAPVAEATDHNRLQNVLGIDGAADANRTLDALQRRRDDTPIASVE